VEVVEQFGWLMMALVPVKVSSVNVTGAIQLGSSWIARPLAVLVKLVSEIAKVLAPVACSPSSP
jgi:hypothetical protein